MMWIDDRGILHIDSDICSLCVRRELYLPGNPITQLRNGAFEFVPQLVKLDLSRCQLTTIDDFAFSHLSLLESLKINNNKLTALSSTTVSSSPFNKHQCQQA